MTDNKSAGAHSRGAIAARTRASMTNASMTKGPLDGVHVLEIAHFIAGPHAAMILCDHGADVIKIEPLSGEHARNAVAVDQYGNSLFFACHNRGKRAVALDLGHADAKKVLDPLLKWADVIITNYAAGVPDKLGFGFERLQQINPRAILVHITGFGSWSDKKKHVAFDGIIQAMSGVWNLNGQPDGPPLNCQVLVGDHGTAAHAANAALCALFERTRTGKGQFIEVGMLEVLSSMLNTLVPDYEVNGEIPKRYGQRPFDRFGGSFKAKDAYFTVAPATPKMWKDLCNLMGHPEWAHPSVGRRPGYISDPELRKQIDRTVDEWAAQRTAEEAVETFQKLGIPSGVVRTMERIFEEEGSKPNSRVLTKVRLPNNPKPVTIPGRSFRFPDETTDIKSAPALNENTFAVLAELGVSPGELEALVASGVVVRPAAEQTSSVAAAG
jgi:crotonobetainyl-CoA:carnitine CoA-transferase CaiB-like acyl-CoA transferase